MENIEIRKAQGSDLEQINRVIRSAVMNRAMPERAKRLAASVLTYRADDLEAYEVLVATFRDEVIGVAAWDPAPLQVLPNGPGGLFHGLYVLPVVRGQGVGERLMNAVYSEARVRRLPGLLIKAQRVSRDYFEHHRLEPLAANDSEYPWQFWKRLV